VRAIKRSEAYVTPPSHKARLCNLGPGAGLSTDSRLGKNHCNGAIQYDGETVIGDKVTQRLGSLEVGGRKG